MHLLTVIFGNIYAHIVAVVLNAMLTVAGYAATVVPTLCIPQDATVSNFYLCCSHLLKNILCDSLGFTAF